MFKCVLFLVSLVANSFSAHLQGGLEPDSPQGVPPTSQVLDVSAREGTISRCIGGRIGIDEVYKRYWENPHDVAQCLRAVAEYVQAAVLLPPRIPTPEYRDVHNLCHIFPEKFLLPPRIPTPEYRDVHNLCHIFPEKFLLPPRIPTPKHRDEHNLCHIFSKKVLLSLRIPTPKHDDEHNSCGILPQEVLLPPILPRSKVLDVGAGDGTISQRIRQQTPTAEVYALEPSEEKPDDFTKCLKVLGEEYVAKLTLQEALSKNPTRYRAAFDLVCVFKYNVSRDQMREFIHALAQVVKPNGRVFVTSVETDRVKKGPGLDPALYFLDVFGEFFGTSRFSERTIGLPNGKQLGRYYEMVFSNPIICAER